MRKCILLSFCFAAFLAASTQAILRASELRQTAAVRAIQRAIPSVANIRSEKTAPTSSTLFANGGPRKINGMGTGIIVDARGYIVTNYHVVEGVDSLHVTLHDGATYEARIISYDREHDLAIIKVDASEPLPEMPLGTSSDIMLGETVIAVGNAYGYEDTVTLGIVSALSRDVEVNETQSYKNLIQTDASINPGNSGGPLVNLDGEVIGINVAIRAGAQRIGFAIPIDDARRVIADLISTKRLDHTYHGLRGTDVKKGRLRELRVESVEPGSPAEEAGFQPGDVVLEVAGRKIADQADFERSLLGRAVGEPVQVVIRRNSKKQTLELALAEYRRSPIARFASRARAATSDPRREEVWELVGIRATPVSAAHQELRRYGYRGGMLVTHVRPNSPAAQNGIQVGDILVGLHLWETLNLDNMLYVLHHPQRESFNPVKFYVLRDGEPLYGHMQIAF
ncbi:MAG: PDZ domain-containing protein [Planctomycetes bacterium]|nr:PDZ domain-containing protein [Planctomycetota bacterium]